MNNELVVDEKLIEEAKKLVKMPFEEQVSFINDVFNKSDLEFGKLAVAIIQVIKDSNNNISDNNKEFMQICDKAIDSFKIALQDGKITNEERKDIQGKIKDILKMANESNEKAINEQKKTKQQAVKAIETVAIAYGALKLAGYIAKLIINKK